MDKDKEAALQTLRGSEFQPRHDGACDGDRDRSANDDDDYLEGDDDGRNDDEDGEDHARRTPHTGTKQRRRGAGKRRRLHFEISELQQLYHLPLKTAAERLGICEAALKRICRRNQIRKWPYRQLQSIRRRMSDLGEQENSRPPVNRDQPSSASHSSSHDAKAFGASRARSQSTRSFLLPHEMQRGPSDFAPLQASSESAVPKRDRLAVLEDERQRVIELAHLTDGTLRSAMDASTREDLLPRAEFGRKLTFEELLSWSVPVFGALEASPSSHSSHARRDSALLLLASVCSDEDKIRELHAHQLAVRRREGEWQSHSGSSELPATFSQQLIFSSNPEFAGAWQ